jgi:hypothetical protein
MSHIPNVKRYCPIEIVCDATATILIGLFYFMRFLEKDLEQIISETGMDLLNERGLPIDGKLFRQLKIGNYGIADLVTLQRPFIEHLPKVGKYQHNGVITIYELKKDKISIGAFLQAIKYARGIQSYLIDRGKLHLYDIKIVLIGHEIDKLGSFCFIPDIFENVQFFTYDYTINGLNFTRHKWYTIIDEGF